MDIHTLDLNFLTDEAIASFVVESSDGPVLVETGPHSTLKNLERGLSDLGYGLEDIKHVLLTHIHFDHAGAAWALAQKGAKVYVHPFGYKHLLAPSKLYNSAKRIYGDQMERLWGLMEGIAEENLISVEDGTEIIVGDATFIGWHTPGHASHHIAWQLGDLVFAGDVAGCKIKQGPVVPPCPPPDINIEDWHASIDRILGLKPSRILLTHFGEVSEVETHFNELKEILQDWAAWMKVPFEQGRDPRDVTPEFQAYANGQLKAKGLSEKEVARYDAANPAWMSVAGLMRYWKKKLGA
ncbi:MAG: MBL fold metallo-hydrolase [Bacteroidia bacterium]|nr:MBL fold metallo-hydrolase [Bacteroidia bacterium]